MGCTRADVGYRVVNGRAEGNPCTGDYFGDQVPLPAELQVAKCIGQPKHITGSWCEPSCDMSTHRRAGPRVEWVEVGGNKACLQFKPSIVTLDNLQPEFAVTQCKDYCLANTQC